MTPINPLPNRNLELQAYDGTGIPNFIDADPSPRILALNRRYNRYLPMVCVLAQPTGRYNCHGLVFGSRRTNIGHVDIPVDIDKLLRIDCFGPIPFPPQPGDIVVYRRPNGEIDHTGFVSRVEKLSNESLVFVWSKWGAYEECEHREVLCQYYEDCEIEYWRFTQ